MCINDFMKYFKL